MILYLQTEVDPRRLEEHIDCALKNIENVDHTAIVLCGTVGILSTAISGRQLILGHHFARILCVQVRPVSGLILVSCIFVSNRTSLILTERKAE